MFPHLLNKYIVVIATFVIALTLSIYPLPFEWRWWRPEFVLLVAIYWVSVFPLTMSLLFLCIVGLFQDLLSAAPLGQHSFSLLVMAYISMMSYRRVQNFALWKETGWVFLVVLLAQIPTVWVQTIFDRPFTGLLFFAPAFTSALLWPLFRQMMERVSSHYRIN